MARAAIAAERARIARELHDVIGHSISVMGVQAGAVRRVLSPRQEREREALLGVERVGREAVTEMRRLLGFLRPVEGGDRGSEPTPTLERVDDLVNEMKRAGIDVDLSGGRTTSMTSRPDRALDRLSNSPGGAHQRAQARAGLTCAGRPAADARKSS